MKSAEALVASGTLVPSSGSLFLPMLIPVRGSRTMICPVAEATATAPERSVGGVSIAPVRALPHALKPVGRKCPKISPVGVPQTRKSPAANGFVLMTVSSLWRSSRFEEDVS